MSDARYVHGLHAARAALRYDPARVVEAWVDPRRRDARMERLRRQLRELGCPVHHAGRGQLDRLAGGEPHQGVVLLCRGAPARGDDDLDAMLDGLAEPAFLLVLDQVQDPHNLGACLRVADAAGMHGVVAPRDRSVGLTATVHKVASGASGSVPFFQVTNLARALRGLRERGIWLYGACDDAPQSAFAADLRGPVALVLGAEERGIRRLTREACDVLLAIPMRGGVASLNVSVAAGVLAFEAVRQRGFA